jgi:hypothetical protein
MKNDETREGPKSTTCQILEFWILFLLVVYPFSIHTFDSSFCVSGAGNRKTLKHPFNDFGRLTFMPNLIALFSFSSFWNFLGWNI